MRRRPGPGPGGAWVDHIWYPDMSGAAYVAARATCNERRRARRVRLEALIEAECDGLGEW